MATREDHVKRFGEDKVKEAVSSPLAALLIRKGLIEEDELLNEFAAAESAAGNGEEADGEEADGEPKRRKKS